MSAAALLCLLAVLFRAPAPLRAQIQMPDPKQMSGIPRPVADLPDHAISVRLIRGSLSNNITDFPVEMHIGTTTQTVKTDAAGRAQFNDVPPGAMVRMIAVVDGERLESQEFPAPAGGGIRLMLVATDREKAAKAAEAAAAPAVAGQVAIGGQSRIIIEPGDEVVRVYYLLDVMNSAQTPISPSTAFTFDVPASAVGAGILEGSSPQATVSGTRVQMQGPFAPGPTLLQIAYEMPAPSGSVQLAQQLPAVLDKLAVVVKKVGETRLTSPQLDKQKEMTAEGEPFIAATGGSIPAGEPFVLTIDGVPHHNAAPRWIALLLAVVIVAIGSWAATRPEDRAVRDAQRTRLAARRERLFGDLVRLESDHRAGRVNAARYASRREEIVASLEHIYGALDTDDGSPDPAGDAGVAA